MNEKVEHSPEPWFIDEYKDPNSPKYGVSSHKGAWSYLAEVVVKLEDEDHLNSVGLANAKRIVAAVNYCEGIPTEFLEANKHPKTSPKPSIEDLKELMQATQELLMDYSIENQKNALYVLQVIKRGLKGA